MSILFPLLAVAGLLTIVAALTVVRKSSLATRRKAESIRAVPKDEWEIDVEVIFVPPSSKDWESAIQRQLDAIENRAPDNELVSSTSVDGRIVLFYKRRVK